MSLWDAQPHQTIPAAWKTILGDSSCAKIIVRLARRSDQLYGRHASLAEARERFNRTHSKPPLSCRLSVIVTVARKKEHLTAADHPTAESPSSRLAVIVAEALKEVLDDTKASHCRVVCQ